MDLTTSGACKWWHIYIYINWNFMQYDMRYIITLRHNGHDGVPNHEPRHCLLNRLFGPRSKKTSKLRVAGFVRGIHRGPGTSPHKWPVTRKMFPFDDVIMSWNFSIVPTIPLLLVLPAATPNAPAIINWKKNNNNVQLGVIVQPRYHITIHWPT